VLLAGTTAWARTGGLALGIIFRTEKKYVVPKTQVRQSTSRKKRRGDVTTYKMKGQTDPLPQELSLDKGGRGKEYWGPKKDVDWEKVGERGQGDGGQSGALIKKIQ